LRRSQDLAKYSLKSSIIEKLNRKGVLNENWIKNETQGIRAREAQCINFCEALREHNLENEGSSSRTKRIYSVQKKLEGRAQGVRVKIKEL
jgi:hypothetical protein